jgi:carboxylate-amine ligase
MADADTAVRTFNALRERLPLLTALAANSPFRHGRDTGLASSREVTLRAWPRSGVPRALEDFADFERVADRLCRAAGVPDYTWFWWKLRPHPRLGTVEVRALDAQTATQDTAALVALVHCLARDGAVAEPVEPTPPELIEEGLFRAARFGTAAELPDAEGRLRAVGGLLDDALQAAGAHAAELGCTEELAAVPELLRRGGGAGRQRSAYELAGMDALLRELSDLTAGGDQA